MRSSKRTAAHVDTQTPGYPQSQKVKKRQTPSLRTVRMTDLGESNKKDSKESDSILTEGSGGCIEKRTTPMTTPASPEIHIQTSSSSSTFIYVTPNREIAVTFTSTWNTVGASQSSEGQNNKTPQADSAPSTPQGSPESNLFLLFPKLLKDANGWLGKKKETLLSHLFGSQDSWTKQENPICKKDGGFGFADNVDTDKGTKSGSKENSDLVDKQGENKKDPSQAPGKDHTVQSPFSPERFKGLLPDHLKGAKGWEKVKGQLEQEQLKSDKNSQTSDTHGERGTETVAQPESSPAQTKPSPTETWLIILPFALLAAAALLYALWRSKSQAARAKTIHGSGRTAGYPRPTGGVDSSKLKPKKRTATAEAPTRSGEVAPVTEREQRVDESPKKDTSFQTHRMRETIQACDEENLRLLLEDRLDEVDDDKADLEKQARDVALLLDEIHGLETPYAGKPDGVVLARLADDLKAELRACDCELLDSDVWNPDIQRAVRVEPTDEPLEHPIILAKQALGVKVRGRLVRKQEVKIKKHIPS